MFKSELPQSAMTKLDMLGGVYRKEFDDQERLRFEKEIEWLDSLRQWKGQYDADTIAKLQPNASKVYPKYSRSSGKKLISRLNKMLFPPNDKNWKIHTTPSPEISNEDMQRVVLQLSGVDPNSPTGEFKTPTPDEINKAIKDLADARCDNMEIEMNDQLQELGYEKTQKDAVASGIKFGTGIIKGPLSIGKETFKIAKNEDGSVIQVPDEEMEPYVTFSRVWDIYPDMNACDPQDMEFVWERYVMNKHQLRSLASRQDFMGDVILQYLRENATGNVQRKHWELELKSMSAEQSQMYDTRRFEVLERSGYVDGQTLQLSGVDISEEDLEKEIPANIWVLGDKVIKIDINPFMENPIPYHFFYYTKDETSIFGTGLPKEQRDYQLAICAAARAALDNAAVVAGPQVELNLDLLEDDQDFESFHSRKIWKRRGRGIDSQYQAVRAVEFNSHIPELIQLLDKFKQMGDEDISAATWMMNEMGKKANETATASMIKSSSLSVDIWDLVKSFDECNESLLRALYKWNMEFNDDDSIKGDFKVDTVGASSLLVREVMNESLNYFSQTLTPEERVYLKEDEFLNIRAKLLNIDPAKFVRTQAEVDKMMEQRQAVEQQAIALQQAQAASEVKYTDSKAAHMFSKAEATNREKDLKTIETLTGGKKKDEVNKPKKRKGI